MRPQTGRWAGFRLASRLPSRMLRAMQKLALFLTHRPLLKGFPHLCALVAALLLSACDKAPVGTPPPAILPTATGTNPAAVAVAPVAAGDFQKLLGRWLRPDGGYILEFKSVAPDGKLVASYLNPRSINVSQAEARKEAGAVKVFVELRDESYPGCTYTLTYDPEHDVLAGVYFQALMGEKFDVGFERVKLDQP